MVAGHHGVGDGERRAAALSQEAAEGAAADYDEPVADGRESGEVERLVPGFLGARAGGGRRSEGE